MKDTPRRTIEKKSRKGNTYLGTVIVGKGFMFFSKIVTKQGQVFKATSNHLWRQYIDLPEELRCQVDKQDYDVMLLNFSRLSERSNKEKLIDTFTKRENSYPGNVFAKLLQDEFNSITLSPYSFKIGLKRVLRESEEIFNNLEVTYIFVECFFDLIEREMKAKGVNKVWKKKNFTLDFTPIMNTVISDFKRSNLKIIDSKYALFDKQTEKPVKI